MDITKAVQRAIESYNKASSFNSQLGARQTVADALVSLFKQSRLSTIVDIELPFIPADAYEVLPARIKEDLFFIRDIQRKRWKDRRRGTRLFHNILAGKLMNLLHRQEREKKWNGRATATLQEIAITK